MSNLLSYSGFPYGPYDPQSYPNLDSLSPFNDDSLYTSIYVTSSLEQMFPDSTTMKPPSPEEIASWPVQSPMKPLVDLPSTPLHSDLMPTTPDNSHSPFSGGLSPAHLHDDSWYSTMPSLTPSMQVSESPYSSASSPMQTMQNSMSPSMSPPVLPSLLDFSESRAASSEAPSTPPLSYSSGTSSFHGDSDSDNDSEYVPSPRVSSRRRPTTTKSRARRPRSSPSASNKLKKTVTGTSSKRANQSRNCQVTSVDPSSPAAKDYKCPHCNWVQANRRLPDFQRHMRTHTRDKDRWHCKGHLLNSTSGQSLLAQGYKPYMFRAVARVGGCQHSFSRRDALKRHLDNINLDCHGFAIEVTDEI